MQILTVRSVLLLFPEEEDERLSARLHPGNEAVAETNRMFLF